MKRDEWQGNRKGRYHTLCLSGKTQFYLRSSCPRMGRNGRRKRMRRGHYAIWTLIYYIICNIIFRNMYRVKCWFRKVVLCKDTVEFKLPSHRKNKSTEAFMFSGGLSVYWILYRGEANAIIIIIIMYQKWQVRFGYTYTVVLEQCPIADYCGGLL